jgi:hypothetical protein
LHIAGTGTIAPTFSKTHDTEPKLVKIVLVVRQRIILLK